MFRPRHPLNRPHCHLQFLIKPHPQCQIRLKSKKVYKGEPPRKSKSPTPSVKKSTVPLPSRADVTKTIPVKKPRDPLQGMREASKKEKIIKYPPLPKKEETDAPEPTPSETTPAETTNEKIEQFEENQSSLQDASATETSSTSYTSPLSSRAPSGPPQYPGGGGPGSRRWMFITMAIVFGVGGIYIYLSKPIQIPPTVETPVDVSTMIEPPPRRQTTRANFDKAIRKLQKFFKDRCSTSPEDLEEFGGEGIMNIGKGMKPRAVIWPENTEEVEIILNIANENNVPVIPYSGGTSVEGQCVPVENAITVSLSRMNKIIEFRPRDMDITLQPGISWNELNAYLKPYKLFLPVDPGPNAHIGGMIATSASGTNAVKYGTMKDWVLNLTVVLPGGHVMKTRSRARKSSTGYDLTRLFVGSEGTLGIITEVTLKLAHLPEKEVVGAIAFDSNTAAANAVGKLLSSGIEPRCVELLDTTCISAVNNSLNTKSIRAFPLKPHLFFKLSGSSNVIPQQQKQLVSVLKAAGGTQLRIAKTEKEGEQLWDIRKSLVYSLVAMFPGSEVISTDVCVPMSRLAGLIEQYKLDEEKINKEIENDAGVVVGEVKKLDSLIIGHVGDGNFHSLIAYEKGNEELKKKAQELENSLVMNALALDGTSSGEHGVGVHKIGFMRSEYDDTALTLMRAIKNGVDPKGIMNPGTLLPLRNQELLPQTSTIDMQSLNEWIVKPKDLEALPEMEPRLLSIVQTQSVAKSSEGESWWNEVKRWGSGIARSVIGSSSVEVPVEVKQKEVLEVWTDQGDGV